MAELCGQAGAAALHDGLHLGGDDGPARGAMVIAGLGALVHVTRLATAAAVPLLPLHMLPVGLPGALLHLFTFATSLCHASTITRLSTPALTETVG